MFFRFNNRFHILSVDDSYARLVGIRRNGDMLFEFTYSVSQTDVVQRNALTVNVSVVSRTVPRPLILKDSHLGNINTQALINNILTQVQNAKTSQQQQQNYTVSSRVSDISAAINNQIVGQLRAGVPASQIPSLTQTRLVSLPVSSLRENNTVQPLLQFAAHSSLLPNNNQTTSSIDLNPRVAMYDMIIRQGLDPSYVAQLTHRSIPAINTLGGTLRPARAPEQPYDPAVQLLNLHLFNHTAAPIRTTTDQVPDNTVVQVAQQVTDDTVELQTILTVPKHAFQQDGESNSHFLVKFDLLDGNSRATIDTVIKELDVARHVQLFYTPRQAPTVKLGVSDISSRINLEIKQVDPGATAVQVYKKILSHAVIDVNDYILIGTYRLDVNQKTLLVPVEKPISSTAIYRVVPVGQLGNIGFEYANVIVRPSRYTPIKAVAVNARPTDSGVEIEVRQFPPSAVAVQVLARNLSTFESDYRTVGDIISIDDASRVTDFVSVLDSLVSENNIYEYVARVIYQSGTTDLSGNSVLEFIKQTPGKVDLKITNLTVTRDGDAPNVTFNLHSELIDDNLDVVLALLKRQDIKEFFNDDIARERSFLKSLIAHNVQRVDLSTGLREDFGVVTTDTFDDSALQKNNAASPLKFGKKYRYEVTPLLRAPETLFETFVKETVDPNTNKPYRFKPSKFLHPLVLDTGTIYTSVGLKARFAESAMAHGQIGTVETVEVSFDDQPARVTNPIAARFNRLLNVITWKLEGSIDQVDHFLIMKDVHGVRTVIGKAHSEFLFGNCLYLHPVTSKDAGELTYIIQPIFNSYQLGDPASSNAITV